VEELAMRGPRAQIDMTGSLSIAQRALDLAGHAALPATKGAKTGAIDLPFSVRGPWDEPSIMADPLSLIERSGAALPLLEAVKARSAVPAAERAMDGAGAAAPQQPPAN
jgi:AsmA protein